MVLDNPTQTIDPFTKEASSLGKMPEKGLTQFGWTNRRIFPKEQIPNMLDEFQFTDEFELHGHADGIQPV